MQGAGLTEGMMDDLIKLKSGNEIYANDLILGISPTLAISQGYDSRITSMPGDGWGTVDKPNWGGLSPADVRELADIAIDRWMRLKALVS
jgi:hypothetical protein